LRVFLLHMTRWREWWFLMHSSEFLPAGLPSLIAVLVLLLVVSMEISTVSWVFFLFSFAARYAITS
jgi:hypothetical protein